MEKQTENRQEVLHRRGFIRSMLMFAGLAASYGTLAAMVLRYLLPARQESSRQKIYITRAELVPPGAGYSFSTPDGESFLLINQGSEGGYTAFSSRCPHLGCKVRWEAEQKQYICPCHKGIFDQSGIALAGPPFKAGQKLKPCEVVLEGSALYALVEKT